MAEFKEVVKQFNRMCKAQEYCDKCLLSKKRGIFTCWRALIEFPDEMEEIVMQWAKENSPITNHDKFKEVFGLDPYIVDLFATMWFEKEYEEPKDD